MLILEICMHALMYQIFLIITVRCMISFKGLDSTALKLHFAISFNHGYNVFVHSLVLLNILAAWGGLPLAVV